MTDLVFAAAACQLAREIFMARKAAYELDDVWNELPKPIRDFYINQAAKILDANRPPSGVKVVGRITPQEPYGVDL